MTGAAGSTAPPWAPQPTPTTQPYWDGIAQGELRIQRCEACARHVFYPREYCPHCGSCSLAWVRATGHARVVTYVISYKPARGFEERCPYVIAIVELDEGVRMMTNLVDIEPSPDVIALDMQVQVTFRIHDGITLPLFRPTSGGRP